MKATRRDTVSDLRKRRWTETLIFSVGMKDGDEKWGEDEMIGSRN